MRTHLLFLLFLLTLPIVVMAQGTISEAKKDSTTTIIQVSKEDMEKHGDEIYKIVDEMPEFADGGLPGLVKYLGSSVRYPKEAYEKGIKGRVVVQFVVNNDGSISDATVVNSVSPELDEEALRVINAMPKWIPGKIKGNPVRIRYTIPINFNF